LASFNATDIQNVDGYTLLLARVDDDTVHVIDFVTTNENEINKVMFNQRPLDVRSFNKDFECTVTKENIRQIYVDFLQPWQDSKSKKKDSYVCNLLVEKDRIELNCPNHDPVVISMDTGVTAIQKLNIRTKELHDFFAKLSKQA
jgi:hypothetical protein